MISWVNSKLERAIGADQLTPSQRRELMSEQVHALLQMAPAMTFGCVSIVTIIVSVAWGSTFFWPVVFWGAALISIQGMSMKAWLASRRQKRRQFASLKAIRAASLNAAALSLCWGILPIIIFNTGNGDLKSIVVISLIAVLCGSGFALTVIPQACISFIIPVSIGCAIALFNNYSLQFSVAFLSLQTAFLAIIGIITVRYARNFTRHVYTEIAMRDQKDVIGLLLNEYEENASDWLWETDAEGRITTASARFRDAASLTAEEARNLHFTDFLASKAYDQSSVETLREYMKFNNPFRDLEVALKFDDQVSYWRLSGKPTFDENRILKGYIGMGSDITQEKKAESKINRLAHLDSLTGLLNRASFTEKLEESVSQLERYGTEFGVLFLDLDKFKLVNDTRGHLVGDELLRHVSARITGAVRKGDQVARLGGDEFAIIMLNDCDAGSAMRLASRLVSDVGAPYEIDNERLSVGVSIGIALAPINGTRSSQLLRNADLALYRAKADGRGVFRFFESQMDADVREKRMLELELRQALENDEFELLYQPLISTHTGKPSAMEALIRWHHPMRGTISPAEFIPIAEQSLLIRELGAWTIQKACEAAKTWPEDVVVAVNLSPQQFVGGDIVNDTKRALAETGLQPDRLELEITESLLISNTEEVAATLNELKKLGVAIALDDFGTGFSSLSYILQMPFDKIKIDRSFVHASTTDKSAKAILKMIAGLGESLNIRITAEGVETEEQLEFLRSIKCDQFQGYLFAKPLKSSDLEAFFADDKPRFSEPKPKRQEVA